MRTIKRNIIQLGAVDEVVITGNPDAIIIAEAAAGVPLLTKAFLIKHLEKFSDDTEIVVTIPLIGGHEAVTYYLTEDVGEGWKPSDVAELTLGRFATG